MKPKTRARRAGGQIEPIPFPARVVAGELASGLRVVTVETPHLHTASVALYVRTGSRYETAANNGLSHFVEHMLFRGSARYPSSFALNSAFEDRCAMLSGETGRDYSLYQVQPKPGDVPAVLQIFGDLFAAPLFADIELERAIVLEEILDDFDERGQRTSIEDVARGQAWPGHPLGFPITGPERNIRRFTLRDVKAHFRRYHGARNLALAVAGPLDSADVMGAAASALAELPPGCQRFPRPAPRTFPGPGLRCVRTDSAQVEVQILFRAIPDDHPRFPALVAFLRLLDDGMATPLHYRVCDRKGLAYHVSAGLDVLADTSLVEIAAACASEKLPALVREIFAIVCELRDQPVAPGAIEKAKRRYARDLEAGFDDVEGLCNWFGDSLLFGRPLRSPSERYRRMAEVDAGQIQSIARQVFRPGNLVATAVGSFSPPLVREVRKLVRTFE
jgi:predicted Zn-dependent peptidase